MIEKLPNLLSKNHDNEEYIKQTKNSTDKIRNELLNSSKKTALTKTTFFLTKITDIFCSAKSKMGVPCVRQDTIFDKKFDKCHVFNQISKSDKIFSIKRKHFVQITRYLKFTLMNIDVKC